MDAEASKIKVTTGVSDNAASVGRLYVTSNESRICCLWLRIALSSALLSLVS